MSEPENPITPTEFRQLYEKSKIDDYQLTDCVISLYAQGFKPAAIVRKCNETLALRTDGKKYAPINYVNITNFIKTKQLDQENSINPQNSQLARISLNVAERIEGVINIVETEMDKVRIVDGPMKESHMNFFTELIKELRANTELLANIQGKLQPSISLAVFTANVENFCKAIRETDKLEPNIKNFVVNLAANMLINDDLLKPITEKK